MSEPSVPRLQSRLNGVFCFVRIRSNYVSGRVLDKVLQSRLAPCSCMKPFFLGSLTGFLIVPMGRSIPPFEVFEPPNFLDRYEKGLTAACLTRLKMLGMQLLIMATDISHITRISELTPFPVHNVKSNTGPWVFAINVRTRGVLIQLISQFSNKCYT